MIELAIVAECFCLQLTFVAWSWKVKTKRSFFFDLPTKLAMKPLDDVIVNILTELIEKYQVYKTGDLNSHRMRNAWIEVSLFYITNQSQLHK